MGRPSSGPASARLSYLNNCTLAQYDSSARKTTAPNMSWPVAMFGGRQNLKRGQPTHEATAASVLVVSFEQSDSRYALMASV
jgi:hypothetical protein